MVTNDEIQKELKASLARIHEEMQRMQLLMLQQERQTRDGATIPRFDGMSLPSMPRVNDLVGED